MNEKEDKLFNTLEKYTNQLDVALKGLKDAWDHCREKSLDDRYQPRKLESFDALAMRFSRTTDVYTQKYYVMFFIY